MQLTQQTFCSFLNSVQIEGCWNGDGKPPEEDVGNEVEDVDSYVLVEEYQLSGCSPQLVLKDQTS